MKDNEGRLKHSDPNYQHPQFPPPPKPYSGRDYYEQIVEAVKEVAIEFGFVVVERMHGDLTQKSLRWKAVYIQEKAGRDSEPIFQAFFRFGYPCPKTYIDSVRTSAIAKIEQHFA